jgi:hypothetical protein
VLVAGVASLVLMPSLVRRPVSTPRLVAGVFCTTRALIAVFGLGWVVL